MTKINFFDFGKKEFECICEECMLNEEYARLLQMKIWGWSIKKMADDLGYSPDNISKMVAKLTKKIKKIL